MNRLDEEDNHGIDVLVIFFDPFMPDGRCSYVHAYDNSFEFSFQIEGQNLHDILATMSAMPVDRKHYYVTNREEIKNALIDIANGSKPKDYGNP